MNTPNIYCATCSVPLGTGRQRERHFCGEYCKQSWPGLHAARNALIVALVLTASRSVEETAELFQLSRRRVEQIVSGR